MFLLARDSNNTLIYLRRGNARAAYFLKENHIHTLIIIPYAIMASCVCYFIRYHHSEHIWKNDSAMIVDSKHYTQYYTTRYISNFMTIYYSRSISFYCIYLVCQSNPNIGKILFNMKLVVDVFLIVFQIEVQYEYKTPIKFSCMSMLVFV